MAAESISVKGTDSRRHTATIVRTMDKQSVELEGDGVCGRSALLGFMGEGSEGEKQRERVGKGLGLGLGIGVGVKARWLKAEITRRERSREGIRSG